ncbi:MAG: hypothetical protein NC218_12155 [Acetobacter sp.]|nr:hypothetical protein [Acetobacter sp.]
MQKLKEVFYFILGGSIVPFLLSFPYAYILRADNLKEFKAYWFISYLLIYLFFPLLYQKNIKKRFPNKYTFYGILYLTFFILGLILFFYCLE